MRNLHNFHFVVLTFHANSKKSTQITCTKLGNLYMFKKILKILTLQQIKTVYSMYTFLVGDHKSNIIKISNP